MTLNFKRWGYILIPLIMIAIMLVLILQSSESEVDEEKIEHLYTLREWEEIYDLTYSPDGKIIAVGSLEGVDLVSDADREIIFSRKGEDAPASKNLDFSPDGSVLAAGWTGVGLYRAEDLTDILSLHGGRQTYFDFAPDGETIATGNLRGLVWLWKTANGEKLNEFDPEVDEWITAIDFSPDGEYLAAGFRDGKVRLWEVASGELAETFEFKVQGEIHDISFFPDSQTLAAVVPDLGREIHLFDLDDGTRKKVLDRPESAVLTLKVSPDGTMLAYGTYGGVVDIWDTGDWSLIDSFDHGSINSVAFSPESDCLAVGSSSGDLYNYQIQKP